MNSVGPSGKATKGEWIGLLVIALPCLIYSMDLTVLDLAVPAISRELRPTSAELLWIIDVYGFVLAGALIPMGVLGDRIGRRRLLMMGAAAFGLMSVIAAFAKSPGLLIAARAVLGLAGATLAPSTLSLIRGMFRDPSQRTVAVGVWISSYSVGGAIGPLVGGVVLEHFSWGTVFLLTVPVMVLLLAVGPILLPEFRDPSAQPIDIRGALLSLSSILAVIYGLKSWVQNGLGPLVVLPILVGTGAGAWFVVSQRRLSDPLIDFRLFRSRRFTAALFAYTVASFAGLGVFIFIAQYLQLVLALSPLRAGFFTAPFAVAFVLGSQLTPPLARRIEPTVLMTAGLVLAAGGFGALARVNTDSGPAFIVAAMFVYSLGLAPVVTLAADSIVGSAPPERAGAAAAISETGAELGGALGIAILGSIGAATYRKMMAQSLPPGLGAGSIEAARDTLGAALAVAEKLPGQAGPALAQAAREAYVSSFRLACIVSAMLAIGTAIATALWVKPGLGARSAVALIPSDEQPRIE